jgi:outer membrane protein
MIKRLPLVTALLCAGLMHTAHATDLLQSWKAAQQNNPDMAAARAVYEQASLRQEQARALWKPTVMATGAVGLGGMDSKTTGAQAMGQSDVTFKTNIDAGLTTRGGVAAQQAWISPEREAQAKQLELSAQMALAQWQQAEQALMLQTAQRYFQVVQAEHALRVMRQQQKAVQQAAQEIAKRQSVGDASVMDVQEANARVSDIRAQVLTIENQLATAQVAYQQSTGLANAQVQGLSDTSPHPRHLDVASTWVQRAQQQSPSLQIMALQQQLQTQEAKRIKASDALSVSWVAQAQMDRTSGHGTYGNATQQMGNYLLGLQLQAPLSTGGMTDAREREALKQADKLSYDQASARLQLEQQVRDAWQNLSTADNRLQALAQSLKASQARLSATRNAHRTGARTTNEWLGAEHDAAQAELNLMQAKIQTALERLRLNAVTGTLGEAQLRDVNALLQ